MAIDTGHGSSYTFSGFVASCREITGSTKTRPSVPTFHLGTSDWETSVEGDLAAPGTVTLEYFFDPVDTTTRPSAVGASASLVITYPTTVSGNTPANSTGDAHVVEVNEPTLATNELMVGTVTFQWNTEPTFTAETA